MTPTTTPVQPAARPARTPARTERAPTAGRGAPGERLLWHGALLFLLGLATGFAIPLAQNPRMGLSAHLEGVLNGMFLLLLGLVWPRLALSARGGRWLLGLALYGTYANWASTLLAALFGTGRSTPLAGAGHAGAPWQEALVDFGLYSLSLAMLAALVLALRGLRPRAPELDSRG